MSRNRHKNKNLSNHPKPKKTLIDERSSYSPNSIGGRIDLESLREKLFIQESNQQTNKPTENAENSKASIQAKGKEE
jgi:hypothetical protein